MNTDHIMPHSDELEEAVIGAALVERDVYTRICDTISEETFYERKNQMIWRAICDLNNSGQTPDMLTVAQYLIKADLLSTIGGPSYLSEVSSKVLSTVNVEQHAQVLNEYYTKRKLISYAATLERAAYEESSDLNEILQKSTDELTGIVAGGTQSIFTLGDTLTSVLKTIEHNMEEPDSINATPTGFSFLDEKGGLQPSNLIIIAGSTSQGKTAFTSSIVLHAITHEKRVAFYSLEMTKEQLTARLLSRGSKVSSNKMLNEPLTELQKGSVGRYMAELYKSGRNLFFDDESTSRISKILSSIRTMKLRYDIDGVVIDYIQILNVNNKNMNKEQQMADVARNLKNLAKELGIWIIAISQLSRDSQNPEPSMDRIRDSGQIAEAADIVMLVYRPETYHRSYGPPFENYSTIGTAEIKVTKGRNVGIGEFICGFDADTTTFYELERPIYKETPRKDTINKEEESPF